MQLNSTFSLELTHTIDLGTSGSTFLHCLSHSLKVTVKEMFMKICFFMFMFIYKLPFLNFTCNYRTQMHISMNFKFNHKFYHVFFLFPIKFVYHTNFILQSFNLFNLTIYSKCVLFLFIIVSFILCCCINLLRLYENLIEICAFAC